MYCLLESPRPQSARKITAITCITWRDGAKSSISCSLELPATHLCTVKIAVYITFWCEIQLFPQYKRNYVCGYIKWYQTHQLFQDARALIIELFFLSFVWNIYPSLTVIKYGNLSRIPTHTHKFLSLTERSWYGQVIITMVGNHPSAFFINRICGEASMSNYNPQLLEMRLIICAVISTLFKMLGPVSI